MQVADTIAAKLKTGLDPYFIEVKDVSHQHVGHAGSREGGQTHFQVTMKAAKFSGKSRIERHRMVTELLSEEFADSVHALELNLSE
ncbi:BolA family transcriptional regulator [Alphaproteobacteria bacterium]|jgi:BolA protein|nr:BolA family transcriptional regulator [Alphaproteobacteria bacterium]